MLTEPQKQVLDEAQKEATRLFNTGKENDHFHSENVRTVMKAVRDGSPVGPEDLKTICLMLLSWLDIKSNNRNRNINDDIDVVKEITERFDISMLFLRIFEMWKMFSRLGGPLHEVIGNRVVAENPLTKNPISRN